ncbi:hypothetical protein BKA80DRAFT_342611 [Phyllosticta citrichinensis]
MARATWSRSWTTRTIVFLFSTLQAGVAKGSPVAENLPSAAVKTPSRRQVSNPATSNFIRRALHSSVVVGNHLFIDGGELTQFIDGYLDSRSSRVNNVTISIDLSSDWTNSSVEIKAVAKGDAPILTWPGLWPHGNDSFFLWGGGVSEVAVNMSTPEKALWKFTVDSTGNGTWAKVDPGDPRVFNQLTRPTNGVWGASSTTGYYIGGWSSSVTDPDVDSTAQVPLTGMVTYNWETQTWNNVSSIPYTSPYGTALGGRMVYVPTFGGEGLLMPMGGLTSSLISWSDDSGLLQMNNLTVYDTATGRWYAQQTTGEAPGKRDQFCVVGAQGADSYEIFLYGGWDASLQIAYHDIYILSLPAFRWFRISSETTGTPRSHHTCHTFASQMVVVGGVDFSLGIPGDWKDPDPWDNGLGVFDLNDLEWKTSYNASAAAYETPQVVKDWYNRGQVLKSGAANVSWDSDGVQSLFSSALTDSSGSDNSTGSTSQRSSNHAGAIAGGVVGGVAAVALLAGLAVFMLRRRRVAGSPSDPVQDKPTAEKDAENLYNELPDRQPEMGDSEDIVHELPDEPTARKSGTR